MTEISSKLVQLLTEKNLTISCAESCTGGLIAKTITDTPGSSQVFWGGVVSYDNSVKENVLKVEKDALDKYGAVSSQVALQMADGVRRLMKTDIGISTTGIAGPGGGTPNKPVGTVYIGISYGGKSEAALLSLSHLGDRSAIREETVKIILENTLEKILGNY